MCGRFYVDDETAREIERLTREVDERIKREAKKGDIHPTETAVVLSGEQGRIVKNEMRWGFPGIKDAKVLINARAESALDKKLFRQNVLSRRLIIPAAGFYEWNQNKEKVTFTSEETKEEKISTIYMAGFYGCVEGENRFVILTTAANASMQEVHNRMPLILEREEIEAWLFQKERLENLLKKVPAPLNKKMEYEQQRLAF